MDELVNKPKNNKMLILFLIIAFLVITIISVGIYYSISISNSDKRINPNYKEDYAVEISQCSEVRKEAGDMWGDDCYSNLAESTGEPGICNEMFIESLKNYCFASLLKDSEYCNNIERANLKDPCYFSVATGSNNSDFCEKIEDVKLRDRCYLDIGSALRDVELCDKISVISTFRKDCYDASGVVEDPDVCKVLSDLEERDRCYFRFEFTDPDDCLRFDDIQNVNGCYWGVAVRIQDDKVCDLMEIDMARCYMAVAVEKKDPSICERIVVSSLKEACLESSTG